MKILLATYWPVPHVGGVWPFMVQLRTKLESMGHQVDLMGTGDDEEKSFVYVINEDRKVFKSQFMSLIQQQLDNYPKQALLDNKLVHYAETQRIYYELCAAHLGLEKYDIIHTHDVISASAINRIRPKSAAMVASIHGCVAHEIRLQLQSFHRSDTNALAQAYYDELEHIGATSAEYTHVANEWTSYNLIKEFGVEEQQIRVFQYGFDIDTFLQQMQLPTSFHKPAHKKVIIYTGRLVELKGIHILIEALKLLKEQRNDWVCWIVGSGEKLAKLKVQAKVLGLNNEVFFLGKQDHIPSLLRSADLFVLPSIIENQPFSLIEAQLAGVPAIVSDVGGLPEMIEHKHTGLLTPVGDPQLLFHHIDWMLSKDKKSKQLSANAKEKALVHWSMDTMIERLLRLYEDAIAKRQLGAAP